MSTDLTVREPEVLEPGQMTLRELADGANSEHELMVGAGKSMLTHAIRAGEYLLAARARTAAGSWRRWLADNFAPSNSTASNYMRIAYHKELVLDAGATTTQIAGLYIRGLAGAPVTNPSHVLHSPDVRDEARRLRASGVSHREVGRLLGVSAGSIRRWCDPAIAAREAQKRRQHEQKYRAERQARKEAEREKALKRAVRKAGAAEQELYAMAERMQDVMGQAHREATDREKREHYALAGEHYRKMRDEIVRALGVS